MGSTSIKRELTGIALLLFSVFLGAALLSLALRGVGAGFDMGPVGRILSEPLVAFVGWPAATLVPLVPAVHALRLFGRMAPATDQSWMVFLAGVVAMLPIAIGLGANAPQGEYSHAAGLWGGFVAFYWRAWFGGVGGWIIVALGLSALTAITLRWNPVRVLVWHRAAAPVAAGEVLLEEPYVPPKRRRKKGDAANLALSLEPAPEEFEALDPITAMQASKNLDADAKEEANIAELEKKRGKKKKADEATPKARREDEIAAAIDATEHPEPSAEELPPADMLALAPPRNAEQGKRELDAMGAKLMEALRTFKVEGELVGRTTGPTVTQYEIEPAPGVKVRQIANLSNDLALAMRAA